MKTRYLTLTLEEVDGDAGERHQIAKKISELELAQVADPGEVILQTISLLDYELDAHLAKVKGAADEPRPGNPAD